MEDFQNIEAKAKLIRKWCLISTTAAGSGHPTSCLSAADLTTMLFDRYFNYDMQQPLNLYNDRFVLSKGHAAPLLYALFAMAGAYPLVELKNLRKFGSRLEGHPTSEYKFAEAATGSLGQGLSVAAGLALVAKQEKIDNRTYVLLGDGELAEGQVWEAANFASYHQLDRLVAIADINRLAQSGETMFGRNTSEYADRFEAFGFETIVINGHDMRAINDAFGQAIYTKTKKPVAIIAQTVKGQGIPFLEDKDGWHGKTLNEKQLEEALAALGTVDDNLKLNLKRPLLYSLATQPTDNKVADPGFEKEHQYATREIFGQNLALLGQQNEAIYVLDADVKNSTFTEDFMKACPGRFIECYIAEQNMVSVAVGLCRMGKIPVVATFAAFLNRAADQIRMARISDANIKFAGSHVGVAIGEDGPSQMGLEDIALFGTIPDTVVLQPADAVSAAKLTAAMINHKGFVYMRTMRPKTPLVYDNKEEFQIGGSKLLRNSATDELTVAASGITVFETLKAADKLNEEGINIRVLDCYSINPIDERALLQSIAATKHPIIITVEDHFAHGGMGDFIAAAVMPSGNAVRIEKMAVSHISRSGNMEQLLSFAGISADSIIEKVNAVISSLVPSANAEAHHH